jgi:predicted RNase H-like nuclease (RuvC/YqgF family)
MPDWVRDWVPLASLFGLIIGILITVLHRAPIVPASRVSTLRQTIADQGDQIANQGDQITRLTQAFDRLTIENERLRGRVEELLEEADYWRRKYQEADRHRSRPTGKEPS